MARGGKRGNPYRDANGRFASASAGRSGLGASRSKSSPAAARKAARSQSGRASTLAARSSLKRSRSKLAGRDPADQRLSSTLSGRAQKAAVTRGNRKLTAAKGAAKTKLQGAATVGTIGKNRPKPVVATARPINQSARIPAAQRPGSMANILGGTLKALAQADAQRIREIESITGQKVRAPRKSAGTPSVATVRPPGRRSVSATLGDNLRQLAQSDARMMRGMAEIARDATPKIGGGRKKAIKGASKALPQGGGAEKPKAPSRTKGSRARLPGMTGVVGKPTGSKRGMSATKANNPSKPESKKLAKKPNIESKSKRKTKQQKADAYVDRINRIGQGRSGAKALRAERIKKQAASFASGLAQYHKRERPKTLQELKKGLSEAFGNKKRMMNYSKFRKENSILSGRPQSGKRSRVRPGQIDRAKKRLWKIKAATMNPFSKSNPNPARQNNSINIRSSEIVKRASSWYNGERSENRAKPLPRPVATPLTSPAKIKGADSVPLKNKSIPVNKTKKSLSMRYKLKTNALGEKISASRGFVAALKRGQRGGFAESAPRLIFRKGKNQQITLSGVVETVKTGKMRQVGYRTSRGSVKLTSQLRRRKPKP